MSEPSGFAPSPAVSPAGWYPDAHGVMRFWDGQGWTEHVAPPAPPASPPHSGGVQAKTILGLVAFALTLVGMLVAAFTQVSLISGMGTVWFGMAIAIGGLVLSFAPKVRWAVRIVCIVLAVIAIASAVYDNHQLDKKRRDLNDIVNGLRAPISNPHSPRGVR